MSRDDGARAPEAAPPPSAALALQGLIALLTDPCTGCDAGGDASDGGGAERVVHRDASGALRADAGAGGVDARDGFDERAASPAARRRRSTGAFERAADAAEPPPTALAPPPPTAAKRRAAFAARLREGLWLTKHSRNRAVAPRKRLLFSIEQPAPGLAPHGARAAPPSELLLAWAPERTRDAALAAAGGAARGGRARVRLADVAGVRLALSPDPRAPGFAGSQTLRDSLHPTHASKAFVVELKHRTLDFNAESAEDARAIVDGLALLRRAEN